jgi:ribonuclease H-related protein
MNKEKKFYAVKVGRQTGVFLTWAECKENITDYPLAKYKSFSTIEEAHSFLLPVEDICLKPNSNKYVMEAYVDGSYDNKNKKYSCGVVYIINNEKYEYNELANDADLVDMRNVAGELMGAMSAMNIAVNNLDTISSLVIYHDYLGISKWCMGEWKANKVGTKSYKKYYDEVSKKLDIKFVKVKAHSGNKYNEEADELASKAILNIKVRKDILPLSKPFTEEILIKAPLTDEEYALLLTVSEDVPTKERSPEPRIYIVNKDNIMDFNAIELTKIIKLDWKKRTKKNLNEIIDFKIIANIDDKSISYEIETKDGKESNSIEVVK